VIHRPVRVYSLFILVITSACILGPPCPEGQTVRSPVCLRYEPETVVLEGRLVQMTYPGPPNFESVEQGDKPEHGYYLKLKSSICLLGVEGDLYNRSHDSLTLLQLVPRQADYRALLADVGKELIVRGTLFGAQTGHHHTPVLLLLEEIKVQ